MTDLVDKDKRKEIALRDALRDAKKAPGHKLPNGALILDSTSPVEVHTEGTESQVLALAEGNFQPFVIWHRTIGVQQLADGSYGPLDYCYAGLYFRNLFEAIKAWEREVEGL